MLIAMIIGVVTAVVGISILDSIISSQGFSSSLSNTIAGYITPIALLGVLGFAAWMSSA